MCQLLSRETCGTAAGKPCTISPTRSCDCRFPKQVRTLADPVDDENEEGAGGSAVDEDDGGGMAFTTQVPTRQVKKSVMATHSTTAGER